MSTKILNLLLVIILFVSCTAQDEDDKSNAIIQRITFSNGLSNAFTDLVYFDNQIFLVYRESDKHVFGRDGVIKLLSSVDGNKWELIKEFSVSGVDLRDPKFSVNGNELMLYIHGATFEGKITTKLTDYRVKYSSHWEKVENVTLDNKIKTEAKYTGNEAWPWRVTWLNKKAYTIAYNGIDIFRFYDSDDGLFFKSKKNNFNFTAVPTEATIVSKDGDFYIMTRRNHGTTLIQKYDVKKEEVKDLGEIPFVNFGGPNFIFLNEKKIIFAGAFEKFLIGSYDLETHESKIIHRIGGGDCGYPGLIIKDNVLWASFYSSHETTNGSSIYIAKIKLEDLSI